MDLHDKGSTNCTLPIMCIIIIYDVMEDLDSNLEWIINWIKNWINAKMEL